MSAPFAMEVNTNEGKALAWWCPGCLAHHAVPLAGSRSWRASGLPKRPTLKPAVLWQASDRTAEELKKPRCHSTMTNGTLIFHDDCTHWLAGKTVPMEPFDG